MKKLFEKALKVESEIIKAELICEERELLDAIWEKFHSETGVQITPLEFYEKIKSELESRKWNIRDFKNSKNEAITNVFKKIVRQICKEQNLNLSNDSLSRILNEVCKYYSSECVLSAGLYPAEAFQNRDSYGIPDDLGDTNSCFRPGGCNEGSALWLVQEYEMFKRAYLVVFHYQSGPKEGFGRCWAYALPNAVYATNFYSRKFEIKEERFRYSIVRLIRKLFDLSENVRFATGKNAPLPIYLNGDGIVIYEPSHYESSYKVLDTMKHLMSRCLWCQDEVEIRSLTKHDEPIYYSPVERRVNGLIVCRHCVYELDDMIECEDCGRLINRNDARYIDGTGYICDECFEYDWFYCDECGEPHRRDHAILTPDNRILCEWCAFRVGAICAHCGQFYYFDKEEEDEVGIEEYKVCRGHWTTEMYLCDRCAKEHLRSYQCVCGEEVHYLDSDFRAEGRLRDMVRLGLCLECYCKRRREAFEGAFENRMHPSLFTFAVDPGERILREILSTEE
jgi:hypothetical protein